MIRRIAAAFVLAVALSLIGLFAAAELRADDRRPVDVALVLAIDVSGSITDANWRLQRDGIAAALESGDFAAALGAGQIGRTAIAVVQWGGTARVVIPFRILTRPLDALHLAADLRALGRRESGGTCMAGAIQSSVDELEPWTDYATRRVIDVSGDGASNCGTDVGPARAAALAEGITINGLPIVTPAEPLVDRWYEDNVIGGPGHFLIAAVGYRQFEEAMRRKLTTEIAEAAQ